MAELGRGHTESDSAQVPGLEALEHPFLSITTATSVGRNVVS